MLHLGWLFPSLDFGQDSFGQQWSRYVLSCLICKPSLCPEAEEPLRKPVPTTGRKEWLHYTPALAVLLTTTPITRLPTCCKGPNQSSCGLDFDNHNLLQETWDPSCPLPLVPKCHNGLWNEWGFACQSFCQNGGEQSRHFLLHGLIFVVY